jgi:alkylhydroperoxidase family enzyme
MQATSFKSWIRGSIQMVALFSTTCRLAGGEAGCLPQLDDAQAWVHLPPLEYGERQPLPGWARMLAESLPRTTALMLELDALHRSRSPLGSTLAGKARWTVAHANRCAYGAASAEADLRRAGLQDADVAALADGIETAPDEERLALAFARRLTIEADTITDDEVRQLIEVYGEQKVVALVLLVAHANFQDRLLLALGAAADLGEPLPPLDARFVKTNQDSAIAVPERVAPAAQTAPAVPERVDDPEWRTLDFAALEQGLDSQRARGARIRVPTWEEVSPTFPPNQQPPHPIRIVWTLVCRGYQPELAAPWSLCLRTFAEEAKQDRVFEESVFWVITRTIHCFY